MIDGFYMFFLIEIIVRFLNILIILLGYLLL